MGSADGDKQGLRPQELQGFGGALGSGEGEVQEGHRGSAETRGGGQGALASVSRSRGPAPVLATYGPAVLAWGWWRELLPPTAPT